MAHVHLDVQAVGGVLLHLVLVDDDGVAPGADDRAVGARLGRHAVVRAAGHLELELVRPHGTVDLILVLVRQVVAHVKRVVAGVLAAAGSHAAARRAQVGAGAAQVEPAIADVVEDGLQLVGVRSQQDDVAGGAVHVREPAAALLPYVADLAQHVARVEPAAGLGHAHRVELADVRELLGHVGVAADDAAAVALHAHDAAVLPVAHLVLVGLLEEPQQIVGHGVLLARALDLGHEAGPRTLLQLVELGGFSLFCHNFLLFSGGFVGTTVPSR